jgi:hypothetical protein
MAGITIRKTGTDNDKSWGDKIILEKGCEFEFTVYSGAFRIAVVSENRTRQGKLAT